MEQHKYDVPPIFPRSSKRSGGHSGDPDGLLWKADLRSLQADDDIARVVRPLTGSSLIDSNASLVTLLARFRDGTGSCWSWVASGSRG